MAALATLRLVLRNGRSATAINPFQNEPQTQGIISDSLDAVDGVAGPAGNGAPAVQRPESDPAFWLALWYRQPAKEFATVAGGIYTLRGDGLG